MHGSSKLHTTRLRGGEEILQKYEKDPTSLQIINEMTLLFKVQSTSTPSHWYYVNVQSNYCDCPDLASGCKHLYALKLIIEKHLQHLLPILPIIDGLQGKDMQCTQDDVG